MNLGQNENVKWNRFAAVTNREEVAFRKNRKIELSLSAESKYWSEFKWTISKFYRSVKSDADAV